MKEARTIEELHQELSKDGFTLVEYFAPWCAPCKGLMMLLEREEQTLLNKGIKLVKVDIENPYLADTVANIRSVPTLVLHENGKSVGVLVGMQSMPKINEWLESNMVDFGDF